jgi:alpha,alpha-trehalase
MANQNPEIFHNLLMDEIHEDGKVFVDAEPLLPIEAIAVKFDQESLRPDFDRRAFYDQHFVYPEMPGQGLKAAPGQTAGQHIEAMWTVLTRYMPDDHHTKLGLPNPTIVPGERFGEDYYWDSYFSMLGLAAAGKWEMVEGMVDNCASRIERFGYPPNGGRTYYLGRSQPPFFSHMVRLLASHKAEEVGADQQDEAVGYGATLVKYLPHMLKEHEFWMNGRKELVNSVGHTALSRVVLMPDGSILNRYYDASNTPRLESYREDMTNATKLLKEGSIFYRDYFRNIRAAAESGWDFSGRWCDDGKNLSTINTTNIVPIDLNCLLYDLEKTIEEALELSGEPAHASYYHFEADRRAQAINKYHYDENKGFYFDYHRTREQQTNYPTLAAVYALNSGISSQEQADAVAERLEKDFLLPGGFATSLVNTKEQWDGEKVWSPLQKMADSGLQRFGHIALAAQGRENWTQRNLELFERTGQFFEKVYGGDKIAPGHGGEYEVQTGFGWTNAVLLDFNNGNKLLV